MIPRGQYNNNEGEIDYGQLYAQVLHEIRELSRAMKALRFESTDCGHITHYKVVPLKAA